MTDNTRALEALAKLESHARVSAGDEGAKRIADTIRAALGEASGLTLKQVEDIVRQHFYPGPVAGSTERLAAALNAALQGQLT